MAAFSLWVAIRVAFRAEIVNILCHALRFSPTLERHLEARLLDLDKLHRERLHLPTAMARAEAGQRIDDLLDEIAELQRMIDASPAVTLEDAAT